MRTVAVLVLVLACTAGTLSSPILGVPAYSFRDDDAPVDSVVGAPSDDADNMEFARLVVSTVRPEAKTTMQPEDVVSLDSAKERSRFLVTLLMLESLHNKPFPVHGVADSKLKQQILDDEELMQEVLKLYETQQGKETKGKKFIKIPPKLLKKMKKKMKELLSA